MSGAVIALAGLVLIIFGPSNDTLSGRLARGLAFVDLAALPVSTIAQSRQGDWERAPRVE